METLGSGLLVKLTKIYRGGIAEVKIKVEGDIMDPTKVYMVVVVVGWKYKQRCRGHNESFLFEVKIIPPKM